jgi:hypothetical protein
MMAGELTGCRSGPMCPCGAVAGEVAGVCEKCRFRARWLRRRLTGSYQGCVSAVKGGDGL